MKVKLLIILGIIVIIAIFFTIINVFVAHDNQPYATRLLKINNKLINIEIAKTKNQQILGLGERDFLASDFGMLFPYDDYAVRRFWMKGMRFPLDIIWIKDDTIVGIEVNVPAPLNKQADLPVYSSPDMVNYVLEVNSGFCELNDINVGDKVEF